MKRAERTVKVNLKRYQITMKVRISKKWSAFLLLFWCLQTMALPVPTGTSRAAAQPIPDGLATPLLSTAPVHQQHGRLRRKASDLDLSSGPVEYMKQLRSSLTNEDGSPTMERDDDPTSVWGLVDKDITQGEYRAKPDGAKCLTTNQFIFGWKSLVESYQLQPLPLQKATLRTYLDVIPRFLQNGPVDMDVSITAKLFNVENSSTGAVATVQRITVDRDSNSWKEFDITQSVQHLWPPVSVDNEVEVTLKLRVNCQQNKKVPGSFVNPATIPLTQKKRRDRHLPLQPLLLIFLSDEEVKKIVKDELRPSEPVEVQESDYAGDENSTVPRVARSAEVEKTCAIEDFPVTFHTLHLFDVLYPVTYNAKRCSGSCSHSTLTKNDHLATNHAKLMASAKIISQIKPNVQFTSPPSDPCCVPTKYRPYAILIQTEEGGAEYVVYPSMVVDECGCR